MIISAQLKRCVLYVAITLAYVNTSLSLSVNRNRYDYDLVIIGAGASGMFAAGTASSFGRRTLLIDKHDFSIEHDSEYEPKFHVGGDCSNAACVPSKAIRAAANLASTTKEIGNLYGRYNGMFESDGKPVNLKQRLGLNFASVARKHASDTVNKVRDRESPEDMADNPNLDLIFSPKVSFDAPHALNIVKPYMYNSTFTGFIDTRKSPLHTGSSHLHKESIQITAKQFIIATGASPVVPQKLRQSAERAGLPLLTYRSLFRPDGEGIASDFLWSLDSSKKRRESNGKTENGKRRRIVIAGGGPTACEIAQSLARLYDASPTGDVEISIVAPAILPSEDIAARAATRKILQEDGINIVHHRKVVKVLRMGQIPLIQLDDTSKIPADTLICAVGREPSQNLKDLGLDKAGVEWSDKEGVLVDSNLRSLSSKHIFACGDAASAVAPRDRRASHAGWTGYHAEQSAVLPKFLLPEDTVHPFVPRVTFLNPEVASIGMTRAECVRKYGRGGFEYLRVKETGTDRSDIDSVGGCDEDESSPSSSKSAHGFVELRVSKPSGRILGATAVSNAASEMINEVGVALCNRLTVRDLARSIHAYPSYGYLMHRASLGLAMNSLPGVLSACGPTGRLLAWTWRTAQRPIVSFKHRMKSESMREWEAKGTELELDYHVSSRFDWDVQSLSYLIASKDSNFCELARQHANDDTTEKDVLTDFIEWLDSKPMR